MLLGVIPALLFDRLAKRISNNR